MSRYSKLVEYTRTDADFYLDIIEEQGLERALNILLASIDHRWNEEEVYDELPMEQTSEKYRDEQYVMVYDNSLNKVCLYIDSNMIDEPSTPPSEFETEVGVEESNILDKQYISSIVKSSISKNYKGSKNDS